MTRKLNFNDGWMFHLGELKQKIKASWSKCGVCGGPSNATNEEGRFYPLPETFWTILGGSGEKAGNGCLNLAEQLTDEWEAVCLPHDWKIRQDYVNPGNISSGTGLHNLGGDCLPTGKGYYRKVFLLPKKYEGSRIVLQFEGVMKNCIVWMNGSMVGKHFSGYSTFEIDVTEYVLYGKEGSNVVLVRTDCEAEEGWWGEGAGIYRDVWLKVLAPVHLEKDGCFVRTKLLTKKEAEILVLTDVRNDTSVFREAEVSVTLFNPVGEEIAKAHSQIEILPLESRRAELAFTLSNPVLWNLENPAMYRAEITITSLQETDNYSQRFGIRAAAYTRNGLELNGEPVELKGVCVHQDFAGVGIALSEDILRYRMQKIKEMGGNAYRSAHHTASRKLLEICDEMGILVLNEVRHFELEQECLEDFEDMIKSSRNHPCVYMYCLGNEEFAELLPQGKRILKRLLETGKVLDPDRPFTEAAQFGRGDSSYQAIPDVAGYNYDNGEARVLLDGNPDIRVMATEDASYLSTRGIYEDSPEQGWCDCYEGESYYAKLLRKNNIDPGTMGGALMSMKLSNVYANNRLQTKELGGMFVWTAFDYRGETFPWNWPAVVSSYGAMDFCGFEKDVFYYWRSIWSSEPLVHTLPHWTWPGKEGKHIRYETYSNCDEVEILINGKSQGKKAHRLGTITSWELCYEPGEFITIGYRNGQEAAREKHCTAKKPDRIELDCIYAGKQHQLFQAKIVDEDGNFCPDSNILVTFEAEGGIICGVGNGNPACHEPDISNSRTTFNGLALCIVSRLQAKLILRASALEVKDGECCL